MNFSDYRGDKWLALLDFEDKLDHIKWYKGFNFSKSQREEHLKWSIRSKKPVATSLILDSLDVPKDGLTLKERITLYNLTHLQ